MYYWRHSCIKGNLACMIRIALVDDKRQMRIGFSEKLREAGDMTLLFMAENGKIFLEEMKSRTREEWPEVVLMDIDMPELNGIETVSMAKEIYPETEFIMLTVFDDDDKIFDAIRAGATGYLLKDERRDQLLAAIRDVHLHKAVPFSPVIARKALQLLSQAPQPAASVEKDTPLSERETEVLQGLVAGDDFREIANKLFVSPHTVRNHIASIYRKLHVANKVQAIKIALKNKWIK